MRRAEDYCEVGSHREGILISGRRQERRNDFQVIFQGLFSTCFKGSIIENRILKKKSFGHDF